MLYLINTTKPIHIDGSMNKIQISLEELLFKDSDKSIKDKRNLKK
jgi:hypothetical protein